MIRVDCEFNIIITNDGKTQVGTTLKTTCSGDLEHIPRKKKKNKN